MAVSIVGAALVLGGGALVIILHSSLSDQIRQTAKLRADDVAKSIEAGVSPKDLADNDKDEVVVQVINSSGRVVAATDNVEGQGRLSHLKPGRSMRLAKSPVDSGAKFILVAESAHNATGTYTVLVGRSTELVSESTSLVTTVLAGGIPLMLLLVGFTTWQIVGRTLAPVEAIRREVDEISAHELYRRVPDPGSRDEIALLAGTMNQMLERLDVSLTEQRRFVSDASHELRSPVASIRQYAEVALAHPETSSLTELAEVVLVEDLRVQHLVEDLLFLARTDERSSHRTHRSVDLDDLVFDEATRLRASTTMTIDASGVSAGRVTGDASQLRRLLRNIGDNASRHGRSTVRLSLGDDARHVRLVIEDDGDGVASGERERIFDRFVRLDEARARDDGGSGLGLAIVKEIAGAHGGTVTVGDSELGGARFEVNLPSTPFA